MANDPQFIFRPNQEIPGLFDIDIENSNELNNYSQIEVTLFIYPYSKQITSDDLTFLPFEEYIDDVRKGEKSTYRKEHSFADTFVGLTLGLIIAFVFLLVKPEEFISIESIVAIIGAYALGKEMWDDFDIFLSSISHGNRIRWIWHHYRYIRQEYGIIRSFWETARYYRNKIPSALPTYVDYIKHSNSKTIFQLYTQDDLSKICDEQNRIRVVSFKIRQKKLKALVEKGFMLGAKLTLTHKVLGIDFNTEYYQAYSNSLVGIIIPKTQKHFNEPELPSDTKWLSGKIIRRQTLKVGKIKIYLGIKYIKKKFPILKVCDIITDREQK